MYEYNVQTPEDAKKSVMEYAGRVEGGDFKWTFTAADESDYDVNAALKAALLAYDGYKPTISKPDDDNPGENDNTGGNEDEDEGNTTVPSSVETLNISNLSNQDLSSSLKVNDFFTITATSEKTVKIE